MSDDIVQSYIERGEDRICALMQKLYEQNRYDDVVQAVNNENARELLFREFGLEHGGKPVDANAISMVDVMNEIEHSGERRVCRLLKMYLNQPDFVQEIITDSEFRSKLYDTLEG